jgi:hypothetical protein
MQLFSPPHLELLSLASIEQRQVPERTTGELKRSRRQEWRDFHCFGDDGEQLAFA